MRSKTTYRIIACLSFIVGITAASIWYVLKYTWRPISMDGASGISMGISGRGVAYSSTTWRSADGVIVDELSVRYLSSEDARKDFEEEIRGDGTIIEQEGTDDNQRAVKIFGNPQTRDGAAEIMRLRGEKLHYVKAVSLRHALAFEKSWLKLSW